VYFTATSFNIFNGSFEVIDSWLITVAPDNSFTTVALSELVPYAPDLCSGLFSEDDLPWPPAPPDAVPTQSPCGKQYLAINMAPALDTNGVILHLFSTIAIPHCRQQRPHPQLARLSDS